MTGYTPNPPLWLVMQSAYFKGRNPGMSEPYGYAAELRAVADWIGNDIADLCSQTYLGASVVATELLAEADRAEAGE